MAQNLPSWHDAYKNRIPNALEKRLEAQRHAVPPAFQAWVISGLPASDPRKQAVLRAQMNGTPMSEEQVNELFQH